MIKKISLKSALSFSWDVIKKNFIYFAGAMLIFWGLLFLQSVVLEDAMAGFARGNNIILESILLLLAGLLKLLVIITIIKVGLYYLQEKDSEEEQKTIVIGLDVDFNELFDSVGQLLFVFLNYLIASILFVLVITQGFALLVIPGIYFSIKCVFYMFYIIDEKYDAIKALEESFYNTNQKELSVLFVLFMLVALIMLSYLVAMFLMIFSEVLAVIILIILLSIILPINLLSLSWIYKNHIST